MTLLLQVREAVLFGSSKEKAKLEKQLEKAEKAEKKREKEMKKEKERLEKNERKEEKKSTIGKMRKSIRRCSFFVF